MCEFILFFLSSAITFKKTFEKENMNYNVLIQTHNLIQTMKTFVQIM